MPPNSQPAKEIRCGRNSKPELQTRAHASFFHPRNQVVLAISLCPSDIALNLIHKLQLITVMSHHPKYLPSRVETLSPFILQTLTLAGPHSYCRNTNHHSSLKHILVPGVSQLGTGSITMGLRRGIKKHRCKGTQTRASGSELAHLAIQAAQKVSSTCEQELSG